MGRRAALPVLVSSGWFALAGAAVASPPWSDPTRVDVPRAEATACGVDFDADGTAVAAATGMERDGGSRRTYLSARAPGGTFEPVRDLAGACTSMVRAGRRSTIVMLEDRVVEVASDGRVVAIARTRADDGAANVQGAAVIAWLDQVGDDELDPWRLQARVRRGGGRTFGAPRTLARPQVDSDADPLGVAVGRRGEIAVVWARTNPDTGRGVIFARLKPARRPRFGPRIRVGKGGSFPAVAATFDGSGRLFVVWAATRLTDAGERYAVRAAALASTSRRTPTRTLDSGTTEQGHLARTMVAGLPQGGAVAAWNAQRETRSDTSPLRVAWAPPAGRFASPQPLAATGHLDDLDVAPRTGSALATWSTTSSPHVESAVMAALAPAPGGFGAPEVLSGPSSWGGQAALDAAGTGVTASWTHWTDDGSGEPPMDVLTADRSR